MQDKIIQIFITGVGEEATIYGLSDFGIVYILSDYDVKNGYSWEKMVDSPTVYPPGYFDESKKNVHTT